MDLDERAPSPVSTAAAPATAVTAPQTSADAVPSSAPERAHASNGHASAPLAETGTAPETAITVEHDGSDAGAGDLEDAGAGAAAAARPSAGKDEDDGDVVMIRASTAVAPVRSRSRDALAHGSDGQRSATAGRDGNVKAPAAKKQASRPATPAAQAAEGSSISPEEIQWDWSAEEWDEWTPSRAAGLDKAQERLNRYAGVKFIYQMADRLSLYGQVLHAASMYFHRFFLRKPMKTVVTEGSSIGYDYNEVAVACVVLASKNEEQHRKLGAVIETAIAIIHYNSNGRNPLGQGSPENFRRWRDTIIAFEDEIFPALCADLIIEQPISMFIEACQVMDTTREQTYNGITILHDINRDVYCQLQPANLQAAAVFYMINVCGGIDLDQYPIPEELKEADTPDHDGDALVKLLFYCETSHMKECLAAIHNFYEWREATVRKTLIELKEEVKARLKRKEPSEGPQSPRRHDSSTGANSVAGQLHASANHLPSTVAFPHPRSNGHRHNTNHNASSSSSSEYTPELGGSAYGEALPPPPPTEPPPPPPLDSAHRSGAENVHESSSRGPSTSEHYSHQHHQHYPPQADRWRPIAAQPPAHQPPSRNQFASRWDDGRARQQTGSSGSGNVPLSPDMTVQLDYGRGSDSTRQPDQGAGYQLESPKLNQDGDEEEGQHLREAGDRRSAAGAPESGSATGARTGQWDARGSAPANERQASQAMDIEGPLSPEMPVDNDDDEEGAVEEDV